MYLIILLFGQTVMLPEQRQPQNSGYLEEIDCRIKGGYSYKYSNNLVTWGHEATHKLNEMAAGPDTWAFYVLGGVSHVFQTPTLRMADVRAEIAENKKCDIYKFYLFQNEFHPMVLFDEQSAYINACYVAKQYRDFEQLKHELENAKKFCYFTERMLVALKKRDYKDYESLLEFHKSQTKRLEVFSD